MSGSIPPLTEHDYPQNKHELVRRNAIDFLKNHVGKLWPKALSAGGNFRWELLLDPTEDTRSNVRKVGEARFSTQFWRANVDPTDPLSFIAGLTFTGVVNGKLMVSPEEFDPLALTEDVNLTNLVQGVPEPGSVLGLLSALGLLAAARRRRRAA